MTSGTDIEDKKSLSSPRPLPDNYKASININYRHINININM
jgi:hypothetical protein